MIEEEIWKDIPDYEGMYQVSNLGRVKSLSRLVRNRQGSWFLKERILKQSIGTTGYYIIVLGGKGNAKTLKIHQLVAISFLNHTSNINRKIVVDHINNNPLDNKLCNLQVISQRENSSKDKKNKSSKYTGVKFCKNSNNYRSSIRVNGKNIHLGMFDSQEEASFYYQNAIKAIENGEEINHKRKEGTSKYKGVSFSKKDKKWISEYYDNKNRKSKRIGGFKTEDEAYEARCKYLESINK